jgi:hypothetical protein
MSQKTNTSGGIGFAGMLTVLFIGLKLTDNIDWSWWWVLSPLWIPLGVVLSIIGTIIVLKIIALIYTNLTSKNKNER